MAGRVHSVVRHSESSQAARFGVGAPHHAVDHPRAAQRGWRNEAPRRSHSVFHRGDFHNASPGGRHMHEPRAALHALALCETPALGLDQVVWSPGQRAFKLPSRRAVPPVDAHHHDVSVHLHSNATPGQILGLQD